MAQQYWAVVCAISSALFQLPLVIGAIRLRRATTAMLGDPNFTAMDGGDVLGVEEHEPGVSRLARSFRPGLFTLVCSGFGIASAVAAVVLGLPH